ncbi:MAG: hypothetical protein ACUVTL_08255, partial [Thermoproteota archaeon]
MRQYNTLDLLKQTNINLRKQSRIAFVFLPKTNVQEITTSLNANDKKPVDGKVVYNASSVIVQKVA